MTQPGIELVPVPEGTFRMGDDTVLFGGMPHDVFLSAYLIGKFPVTGGQYQQFIDAGGYTSPELWSEKGNKWRRLRESRCQPACWNETVEFGGGDRAFQGERHPAVVVSYYEAEAFCQWFGGRLPTEAEGEKAAGWNPDQQRMRKYPWGDEWDVQLCNCSENSDYPLWTSPVDAFPGGRSYCGCLDMLGNGGPRPSRMGECYGTSCLPEFGDERIMVDCGPGTTYKMARMGMRPTQINTVFLTHHHSDHIVDFPCLALLRFDLDPGDLPPLKVYGPPPTVEFADRLFRKRGASTRTSLHDRNTPSATTGTWSAAARCRGRASRSRPTTWNQAR